MRFRVLEADGWKIFRSNMSGMTYPPDKLLQYEFIGTLYFLPSSEESSAICQLEFASWGPDMASRISLRDKNYDIQNELLLCPDGERRFFSRRNIVPYDSGAEVQLVIVKDRLTHVTIDDVPHLRVVGDWIERTEDKNGKVRTTSWGIEGLLKQSGLPSASLDQRDRDTLGVLRRNWREVCE